jgi:hypothetical protein
LVGSHVGIKECPKVPPNVKNCVVDSLNLDFI